jgi:hypothetical protein
MKNQIIKRSAFGIMISMIFSLFLISCEYEFIEVELPDANTPVSFSEEILPIFTANNNCTACHKAGSTSPDLTAANAFNSIVPDLVNLDEPELSKIYTFPNPSTGTHGFKKYTQLEAALVLSWITQGAENN